MRLERGSAARSHQLGAAVRAGRMRQAGRSERIVGACSRSGPDVCRAAFVITIRPLPASFELSAYRIVQEALTDVRRHAGAAHVTVNLRFGADALEVSIEDAGPGATAASRSTEPRPLDR